MNKLLYHKVADTVSAECSVFSYEALKMVVGHPVKMVSPYLSLEVLERIIDASGKEEWQLITDVNELIRSLGHPARNDFTKFIAHNLHRVRHISDLHAKVLLVEQKAIVGSANFTVSGLSKRTEMSILLDEVDSVKELGRWFSELWRRGAEVDVSRLEALASKLPIIVSESKGSFPLLESPGVKVQCPLFPQKENSSDNKSSKRFLWTETAFLNHVAEKFPHQLDAHKQLIEKLRRLGVVQFRGTGEQNATYNADVPKCTRSVMDLYDDGRVYVRWGAFPDVAIKEAYKSMWDDRLSRSTETNGDGFTYNTASSGTKGADLSEDVIDRIVANLTKLKELATKSENAV